MKHYLLLSLLATSALTLQAQITETASEAVKNMGVGWNLGNTLDANAASGTNIDLASYWGQQDLNSETYWGQHKTKPELMTMMKNAGFGAIRVPVTWFNHMDKDGNVDKEWMKRVHEIVDYVIDNNMYCILNVHHDTGAGSDSQKHWLQADEQVYEKVKDKYEKLWKQIAEEFKDYGKELLFEGYNEMLDPLNSWCFASFAASGQYNATVATSAYNAINKYAQSFVNTVRATGGNNESRNLIVSTYAASNGSGDWNAHLKDPVTKLNMPDDKTAGHIIFEVHAYPTIADSNTGKPYTSTVIKKNIDNMITILKDNLVSKGGPVIIGEWGTSNVDKSGATDYDLHRTELFQFVDYFVKQTKAAGIGTFYWMGLTDGLYRTKPAFNQADLAERIAKAYHGSSFEGQYPTMSDSESESVTAFEGETTLGWGSPNVTIANALFASFKEPAELVLTYVQNAVSVAGEGAEDDIQFFYGDWSATVPSTVDGVNYNGDFQPSLVYKTPAGTQHETTFTFDESVFNTLQARGILMHGVGVTIKKAVLKSTTSGLEQVLMTSDNDEIYNILGVKVKEMKPGNIYIKNGKKIIAR